MRCLFRPQRGGQIPEPVRATLAQLRLPQALHFDTFQHHPSLLLFVCLSMMSFQISGKSATLPQCSVQGLPEPSRDATTED